jgi:hypothetical protein
MSNVSHFWLRHIELTEIDRQIPSFLSDYHPIADTSAAWPGPARERGASRLR